MKTQPKTLLSHADLEATGSALESCRTTLRGQIQFNNPPFDDYLTVLTQLPLLRNLVESDRRTVCREAARAAAMHGPIQAETLLSEISVAYRRHRSQPRVPYEILTTLSLRVPEGMRPRRFGGTAVRFSDSIPEGFVSLHPTDLFDDTVMEVRHRGPWVRAATNGRSPLEAGERALWSVDLLRGIWNLGFLRRQWRALVLLPETPLNPVRLGPLHTLHHPNGELVGSSPHYWYEPFPFGFARMGLGSPDWTEALRMEERVQPLLVGSPMGRFLEQILVRYARALDSPDPNVSYLRLWGVLEDALGRDGERLVTRLAMCSAEPEIGRPLLRVLHEQRHAVAHLGHESPYRRSHLETLHWYASNFLDTLVAHFTLFERPKEFLAFLDLYPDLDALGNGFDTRARHAPAPFPRTSRLVIESS